MAHSTTSTLQRCSENILVALACFVMLTAPLRAGTLVEVNTSLGDFYLELYDEAAPITVANFLNYVRSGRFNNTYIHAVELLSVAAAILLAIVMQGLYQSTPMRLFHLKSQGCPIFREP